MRKKVTNVFAPKQMSKKNIVKSLYTAAVTVLMVLVLLPSMFLIYVGGRVTSLIGYVGFLATILECLLIRFPFSQDSTDRR